ncbi:Flp family type IVb pilin [Bradyrhizobium sp. CB3481]|uniref:Flp family type IVb pilin n=1 Tax=Bradyrhizobium sp. CB3481 TaxID=3039158 RepID=UPI0024B1C2D3|nr:Flp family type IVb pilin [Bradyrhizobium sp. CB3481]WFU14839.1 Flp family type IVb pilin [Bradyrhizobium sp. CB3481]
MKSFPFLRFRLDKSGATSIEYGLIAVVISLPLVVALTGLRTNHNLDCSSSPSPNLSTGQLDKLDFVREPSNRSSTKLPQVPQIDEVKGIDKNAGVHGPE